MRPSKRRETHPRARVAVAAVTALAGWLSVLGYAQDGPRPPVQMTAEQDRQRIMDALGITSIPPGAQSSNPDTYDESNADPFPALPNPLTTEDGRRVTSPDMWWKVRRPETIELFEREVYGRTPRTTPAVKWAVTNSVNDGQTITKQLVGRVDNT